MSQRARFENRAKLIARGVKKGDTLPPAKSKEEAWKEVKTPEQVAQFYQLYYPQLPDVLCTALGHMMGRAVAGEITLPELYTEKKIQTSSWDYEKDINEMKTQGQLQNSIKKMEELMMVHVPEIQPTVIAVVDPQEEQKV